MRKMRIGIVGGQKRKTEAHLFKSLEKMDIEVAWHVEAMTKQEFSDDCDAIVSMVDYVGHNLFALAKAFAAKKNIPFRQISFNWSKTQPTFVELQTKFNAMNNNSKEEHGDTDMHKIPRANEYMLNITECMQRFKVSNRTFEKLAGEGKFRTHPVTVGNFNGKLYDSREVEAALMDFRTPKLEENDNVEAALHDDGNGHLKSVPIVVFESGIKKAGELIEQTVSEILAPDNKETNDRTAKILYGENKENLILCLSSVNGTGLNILKPLTRVSSMEEAKELSTVDLNPNSNEFVVISVVGSFKTLPRTAFDFEETSWSK